MTGDDGARIDVEEGYSGGNADAGELNTDFENDVTAGPGRDDDSLGYQIETALLLILGRGKYLIRSGFEVQLAMGLILEWIDKLQQNSILNKDAFVTEFLFRCDPSNKENREDAMYLTALAALALLSAASTKQDGGSATFESGEKLEELVRQIRIGFELVDEFVELRLVEEEKHGGERLRVQLKAWKIEVKDDYERSPVFRQTYFEEDRARLEQQTATGKGDKSRRSASGRKRGEKTAFKSKAIVENSSDDNDVSDLDIAEPTGPAVTNEALKTAPTLDEEQEIEGAVAAAGDAADRVQGPQQRPQQLSRVIHTPSQDSDFRYIW